MHVRVLRYTYFTTNIMDGVILREATIVSTWELVMLNKVKCPGYIHQIKNDYKIDIALIY